MINQKVKTVKTNNNYEDAERFPLFAKVKHDHDIGVYIKAQDVCLSSTYWVMGAARHRC